MRAHQLAQPDPEDEGAETSHTASRLWSSSLPHASFPYPEPAGSIRAAASPLICSRLYHVKVYVHVARVLSMLTRRSRTAASCILRRVVESSAHCTGCRAKTAAAFLHTIAQKMSCFITVMIATCLCGCCISMLTTRAMMAGHWQLMSMTCALHMSSQIRNESFTAG